MSGAFSLRDGARVPEAGCGPGATAAGIKGGRAPPARSVALCYWLRLDRRNRDRNRDRDRDGKPRKPRPRLGVRNKTLSFRHL